MFFFLFLLSPLFSSSLPNPTTLHLRTPASTPPIIGILSQPSPWLSLYDSDDYSYIASSYVKSLEAAGARVLPLKYDWEDDKIQEVFEGINGLFLPGGGAELINQGADGYELTRYGRIGVKILRIAKEINDKGVYFPVWGTCLGFELMILAISGDLTILENVTSLNYSNSLNFVEGYQNSRLYKEMDKESVKELNEQKVTYFNHKYGLNVNSFLSNL